MTLAIGSQFAVTGIKAVEKSAFGVAGEVPLPDGACRVVDTDDPFLPFRGVVCELPLLPYRHSVDVFVTVQVVQPGPSTFLVRASSNTPDPKSDNNELARDLFAVKMPDVEGAHGDQSGARGRAAVLNGQDSSETLPVESVTKPAAQTAATIDELSRLSRVEIAVLRRDGKRCRWLKNTKAQFKRLKPAGKKCDKGLWLKAKGTKKWSIRFKKQLPPGKYRLYARAVNRAGVTERNFTRKDGNRVDFTVKKRKRRR